MMTRSSSLMSRAKVGRGLRSRNTKVAIAFRCGAMRSSGASPQGADVDLGSRLADARLRRLGSSWYERHAEHGRSSGAKRQSLDRPLGQADDVALGVGEECKRQSEIWNLSRRNHGRAAELLGLRQIRGGVVPPDVKRDPPSPAVLAGPDPAGDSLLARVDQPVARPVTSV